MPIRGDIDGHPVCALTEYGYRRPSPWRGAPAAVTVVPVKIATWNVNSIRTRLPRLLAWLERRRPDVVCLQEIKVTDDLFPNAELEALGYRALVAGQQTYNGVAILSRASATELARTLPGEGEDAQRRLLVAAVGGLRVVNVYGPNGQEVGSDKYAYKLDWYRRFRAFLEASASPAEPLVVCGDLNIAPEDRDVWDPEKWRGQIMFSDPERAVFRDLVAWGLRDSLRLRREEGGLFTWWDYRAGAFHRGWGLRIDHILLAPAVAARCTLVEIDRDERKGPKPSDHAPVVATLAD